MTRVSQKRHAPESPFGQRISIEQCPLERLIDRREDRRDLADATPHSSLRHRRLNRGSDHCSRVHARFFANCYKVQKTAGRNVIVDEVSAWPDPVCDIEREAEMRDAFCGSKPPIGDLPGEPSISSPNSHPRTRECIPSAPIRRSPRSDPPSSKWAVTPLSSCPMSTKRRPSLMSWGPNASARRATRSARWK